MKMSPGDFIRAVVAALHLPEGKYHIGVSRLFFKTGGAEFLQQLQYAARNPAQFGAFPAQFSDGLSITSAGMPSRRRSSPS